jgi:3-deoxy-manno-octulosonate cytidylyltransferase (CMP-KDO synthetase)
MSGGPFNVVIPARFASSRLPGKPLADIGGKPMVVHVAQRARQSGAGAVVVATDDERVADAVLDAGCDACLTRSDHVSGSDRVMEVAQARGWSADSVVVNVQGDEPLIPPAVIAQVADLLVRDPDSGVATLCEPIEDLADVFDPNVVKVVIGADGFAVYFSRAPIPYARDAFAGAWSAAPAEGQLPRLAQSPQCWQRHIGIYAFRVAALQQFVGMPPGVLEQLEALEQLRLVERRIGIRVVPALAAVPGGVDTPADLERMRGIFAGT